MTRNLLALAGALVLSTSSYVVAQDAQVPAVIVPAGSSADVEVAQAAPAAPPAAAPAAPAAAAPAAAAPAAGATGAPAGGAGAAAATSGAPAPTPGAAPAAGAATAEAGAEPKPGVMSLDSKEAGTEATPGEEGKFVDSAGSPIYAKTEDGTFDYQTWRGYKKYSANCLACHGPDGLGSSFAPNLTESLQRINYYDFAGIIVNGQQNKWHPVNSIMPAWGEDLNVMCFLDGIYVYLRGRADGAIGRGEPKKPSVNKEAQAAENACLGF